MDSSLWTGQFPIEGVTDQFLSLPCFIEIPVYITNRVEPDQMPLSLASDQDLRHHFIVQTVVKSNRDNCSSCTRPSLFRVVSLSLPCHGQFQQTTSWRHFTIIIASSRRFCPFKIPLFYSRSKKTSKKYLIRLLTGAIANPQWFNLPMYFRGSKDVRAIGSTVW